MLQKSILIELHHFPSIQYLSKFLLYADVFLEQHENYSKGSYRNRMHIATANGLLRLSIPLEKGKNQQGLIRDIKISYDETWQNKHWMAIQSAYGNAPYFAHYADALRPFFKQKYTYLFDYNLAILQQLLLFLDMDSLIHLSPNYAAEPSSTIADFRNAISPKQHKNRVDPYFKSAEYPQIFKEKTGFLPNLSILDLLFCQGPETLFVLKRSIVK